MAYLELSLEAYDNLIKAAGMKASSVARVCEEQGVWEPKAAEEAPPGVEPTDEPDYGAIKTDVDFGGMQEGAGHD